MTSGSVLKTDPETSARLARVRQHDTKPELAVRRLVTRLGRRYRVSNRDLPGSPDLANRRRRWAIFVHGCFWHDHRGCALATKPKRNAEFWAAKLAKNRERDQLAVDDLTRHGFRVLVIWECWTREPPVVEAQLSGFLS